MTRVSTVSPASAEGGDERKKQEESDAKLPAGLLSIILLLFSGLAANFELFNSSGAVKATTKAATKAASKKLGGPLGVIVESIADATKIVTKSKEGFLQRAVAFAVLMLRKPEAAQAFQGLIMVAGLAVALAAIVGAALFNAVGGKQKKFSLRGLLFAVACGVPVAIFGVLRWESVVKVLRALVKDGLLPQLVLPLRTAGIIAAGGIDGQTPTSFAIFQVAAIVTRVVSDTNLVGIIVNAVRSGEILAAFSHFDNDLFATFIPAFLAVFWIGAMRLRRAPDLLCVGLVLGMCATPAALSKTWPPIATVVGVQHSKFAHPDALVYMLSIAHVTASLGLFVIGGPVSMLVCAVLFQVLTRVHGTEGFAALMPQ
jgi:hypothetical protein